MSSIYCANYKKSLTVKQLKNLLNELPADYEDAVVVIQSSLLERNTPLEINEIKLTNAAALFDWMYDECDEEEINKEINKAENTKVLFLDGDKFQFELF